MLFHLVEEVVIDTTDYASLGFHLFSWQYGSFCYIFLGYPSCLTTLNSVNTSSGKYS